MKSDHFCQIEYLPPDNEINNYDNIAQIYDLVMGEDIAKILIKLSNIIIKKNASKSKLKLLDLACGSGAYIYHFNKYFKAESIGIDLSAGQLLMAKNKCKNLNVNFIQGDLIITHFPKSIDVVTINLDALNHITSIKDWRKLFNKVYDSLNDNGIFIFDINSRKRLLYDWNSPEVILKKKLTYVQCGLKPTIESNVIRRKILMIIFQEINNHINKYSATIEQISVYKKDVYKMLNDAKFSKIQEYYKYNIDKLEHIFLKNRYFFCAYK